MRSRPVRTALAGVALAVMAVTGLSACSSSSSDAPASEINLSGSPVTANEEMTALCAQIIEQAMPLEAAVAVAEAGGYTTRVGTLDGEGQAVTTDLREDRFTFDVEAGIVTGCTIG
jgi:hypothetical protein